MVFFALSQLSLVIGGLTGLVFLAGNHSHESERRQIGAVGSGLALFAFYLLWRSRAVIPCKAFIPRGIEGCIDFGTYIAAVVFAVPALWLIGRGKGVLCRICGASLLFTLGCTYARAKTEIYG